MLITFQSFEIKHLTQIDFNGHFHDIVRFRRLRIHATGTTRDPMFEVRKFETRKTVQIISEKCRRNTSRKPMSGDEQYRFKPTMTYDDFYYRKTFFLLSFYYLKSLMHDIILLRKLPKSGKYSRKQQTSRCHFQGMAIFCSHVCLVLPLWWVTRLLCRLITSILELRILGFRNHLVVYKALIGPFDLNKSYLASWREFN